MLENLNKLKRELDREGILLTFCGPMSHGIVEGIGNALRNKMEEDEVSRNITSKVFSIFVEQVQNVIHYSCEPVLEDEGMRFGIVLVGKTDEYFFVMGGNKVSKSQVTQLRENLTMLQSMNKEELKALYRKKRKEAPHSASKGAGIGFIEMARKSSAPIEFSFEDLDSNYSFFTVKIKV